MDIQFTNALLTTIALLLACIVANLIGIGLMVGSKADRILSQVLYGVALLDKPHLRYNEHAQQAATIHKQATAVGVRYGGLIAKDLAKFRTN